jgi:molecular chaperone DnaK (HSP70)
MKYYYAVLFPSFSLFSSSKNVSEVLSMVKFMFSNLSWWITLNLEKFLIGSWTKSGFILHPKTTLYQIKRLLGKKFSDSNVQSIRKKNYISHHIWCR